MTERALKACDGATYKSGDEAIAGATQRYLGGETGPLLSDEDMPIGACDEVDKDEKHTQFCVSASVRLLSCECKQARPLVALMFMT